MMEGGDGEQEAAEAAVDVAFAEDEAQGNEGNGQEDEDQSWDDLAEAPLEFDPEDPICGPCEDQEDVFVSSDGGEFQRAKGVSTPKAPSKEVQARHNLTHLPYA